ncbi:hypothetical protein AB5I41_19125 [Sphingomonas sp. MMS24-JH45]
MKRHRAGEDDARAGGGHPPVDQRDRHGAAEFGLTYPHAGGGAACR